MRSGQTLSCHNLSSLNPGRLISIQASATASECHYLSIIVMSMWVVMAWQIAFVPVYLVGSSFKQPKHPPGLHPSGKSPASKEQRYGRWMFAGRGGERKGGRERKREFHPIIRFQTPLGQHPKRTWACLEDSPWVWTLFQSQLLHNRRTSYLNIKEYLTLAAIWMDLEIIISRASPVAQMVKNLATMQETQVQPLGWEDPLEKRMATHSSILAWRIPLDRGAYWATVHGVAKSWTRLSKYTFRDYHTEWSKSDRER